MSINRRNFVKATGLVAAASSTPTILRAQTSKRRVVVVGGGFGGATAAKYLKHWGGNNLDVTLIDPKARHTSCVMSNLVLNGRLKLSDLRFDYTAMQAKYGVDVIRDTVKTIDPANRILTLKNQAAQHYDMLILATGISFKKPSGWNTQNMPHAWIAGGQTNLLKKKLAAMSAGETFIMTIPKSPYRCPPGPYERACLVADILKRRGGGRVIVLDANDKIQAERETFGRAFDELYGDIIEYYTDAELNAIDGDVVVTTYESTLSGFEDIHIIGDSQGSGQPKSAHMANAQAKVCADAIIRKLASQPTDHTERLENLTTNSACYSPITYDTASWLTAVFQYDAGSKQMKLSQIGEAGEWTQESYQDMFDWSANLFTDTFA